MVQEDPLTPRPMSERRAKRLRLGKLRILFAAIFVLALGYGISLVVDKLDGEPAPAPHQLIDQAK